MSKQRKPWPVPKLWPGETVFIIGGGPSLKGFDFTPLHGKRVIGVNQAFRLGNWVDLVYFGDCGFWSQNKEALTQYTGLIVTSCTRVPPLGDGWPRVRRVGRSKNMGIEYKQKGYISWNRNSGGSAINLAYWLGAKRVVLLGFDMKPDGNQHNWHDHYGKRAAGFNPYKAHLLGFKVIAKEAKTLGMEILNANPDSMIPDFSKLPFDKVMELER